MLAGQALSRRADLSIASDRRYRGGNHKRFHPLLVPGRKSRVNPCASNRTPPVNDAAGFEGLAKGGEGELRLPLLRRHRHLDHARLQRRQARESGPREVQNSAPRSKLTRWAAVREQDDDAALTVGDK